MEGVEEAERRVAGPRAAGLGDNEKREKKRRKKGEKREAGEGAEGSARKGEIATAVVGRSCRMWRALGGEDDRGSMWEKKGKTRRGFEI